MQNISSQDLNEFTDYFLKFYEDDKELRKELIPIALGVRLERRPDMPFDGDSIDREEVRGIIFEMEN